MQHTTTRPNVEDILLNGGGTYSQDGNPVPVTGYFVSLYGHEEVVPVEEFTQEVIDTYVAGLSKVTTYIEPHRMVETPVYIGFWVDDGKVYLDASINVGSRGLALRLGVRYQQQAVWDVEAGEALPVRTYQITLPETYVTTYEVAASSEDDIREAVGSGVLNDFVMGRDLSLSHRDPGQMVVVSDNL